MEIEDALARSLKRELGIPSDSARSLEKLRVEYGITPQTTTASGVIPELGPRSGISDADRLLRGLRLGKVEAETLERAALKTQRAVPVTDADSTTDATTRDDVSFTAYEPANERASSKKKQKCVAFAGKINPRTNLKPRVLQKAPPRGQRGVKEAFFSSAFA